MLAPLVSAALFLSGALAQFTINTPIAVQCEPVLLTWSGGSPPYILSVLPGGQPEAAALEDLGSGLTGTSFTWLVNIAAGQSVGIDLRDSTGVIAQTAPFTIQSSSNSTCVGQSVSGSAGSATAPATTGAATSGSSPATTTAPGATTGSSTTRSSASAGSGSSSSTSSSATPSQTSSAGSPAVVAPLGAAAALGAVFAAILA